MKAKDTVMSWEGIRIVFQEQDKKGTTNNMFIMEALCLAQAEISFKMGATQAIAKTINPAGVLYEKAKQEGIKEVVDWIEAEDAIDRIMRGHWQAKLKDWGIDE